MRRTAKPWTQRSTKSRRRYRRRSPHAVLAADGRDQRHKLDLLAHPDAYRGLFDR